MALESKPATGLTRRDFMRWTAGGVAASALTGCSQSQLARFAGGTGPQNQPNVLVIFDDQLRAQACSLYGGQNITTPNIDRLAARGVTFNNATSMCPVCTPFRGMLHTGRYANHTGIICNFVETNPNQTCLAHAFGRAGYDTGFIGKWHLAGGAKKFAGKHEVTKEDHERIRLGKERMFRETPEHAFVPPGPARLGYEHWEAYNFHCSFNDYWFYRDEPKKVYSDKYETDTQADQVIDYIRKHQASGTNRPFMLTMAPHPPHPPFGLKDCPAGYRDKVRRDLQWPANVPENRRSDKNYEDALSYHAMIKNVDDNLGRILDFLDKAGLAEDTIILFTSDHGEMLGSHDRRNKMVPYAEAVNIPAIVSCPGRIPQGVRTDTVLSTIDFMPTLGGLAGVAMPDNLDGLDLSATIRTGARADRDGILMANYLSNWDFFDTGTRWPEWRAVRTDRHTYVKWLTGKEELYDNLEDSAQMQNLVEGQQDLPTLQKLRRRLKELLADAHDGFGPGTGYADWFDDERNLLRTDLGPVKAG